MKRRGFTLLETLLVIATVAVLIAILLPSLSRSRDSARQIKCLANLKSLREATEMYRNENNELFPFAESMADLYPVGIRAPFDALSGYLSIVLPSSPEQPVKGPDPLWCPADRLEINPSGLSYLYMPWDLMAMWPGDQARKQRGASVALGNAPDEPLFMENLRRHNANVIGVVDVKGAVTMKSD
jgi:prepilin-type N-terminal cleavage/methylation domain-containing protein